MGSNLVNATLSWQTYRMERNLTCTKRVTLMVMVMLPNRLNTIVIVETLHNTAILPIINSYQQPQSD